MGITLPMLMISAGRRSHIDFIQVNDGIVELSGIIERLVLVRLLFIIIAILVVIVPIIILIVIIIIISIPIHLNIPLHLLNLTRLTILLLILLFVLVSLRVGLVASHPAFFRTKHAAILGIHPRLQSPFIGSPPYTNGGIVPRRDNVLPRRIECHPLDGRCVTIPPQDFKRVEVVNVHSRGIAHSSHCRKPSHSRIYLTTTTTVIEDMVQLPNNNGIDTVQTTTDQMTIIRRPCQPHHIQMMPPANGNPIPMLNVHVCLAATVQIAFREGRAGGSNVDVDVGVIAGGGEVDSAGGEAEGEDGAFVGGYGGE
mmetsp:Transcript_14592/g.26465  ORF Transcript_14592/g.26465 Transcript_14592/m.26465 type:complete len:311 (-) Transcript_14592:1055-1987(-)